MIFENLDVGPGADGVDHDAFEFGAGDVAGVEDAALVMPAFTAEIELFGAFGEPEFAAGGEFRAEPDQFLNRFRAAFDDGAHGADVAQSGAGVEGVLDMFVEGVEIVHDAGDASLGETAVAFVDLALGENRDRMARIGEMKCAFQSGQTAADDQMVEFQYFAVVDHFRKLPAFVENLCFDDCHLCKCVVNYTENRLLSINQVG